MKRKNRSNFFNTAVILSGEYIWMIFHFLLHISHSRIIFEVIRTCLPYSAAWAAMNHIYLLQRCQPVEISNLEIFFWTSTSPPMWLPSRKFFFNLDPIPPPPPPPPSNSAGKTWIYLSGTSISWIFIQSNSCLYRCNKEKTLFFLFATTTVQSCITLENDARNHNESIRSQMILEFWNLWSLNPSFLWATDPNFLLCRSFCYPCRRAEDWLCIQESWHMCYCIFKKRKTLQKLYLS